MRNNQLRIAALKLLPSVSNTLIREILQCFDNNDPIDPTIDTTECYVIHAATLFKDLLEDGKLLPNESGLISTLLSSKDIRDALYRAEIKPNETIFNFCVENYSNAYSHLKVLLSFAPTTDDDIKFYTEILDLVVKNMSSFSMKAHNKEVISILLHYPLTISDDGFRIFTFHGSDFLVDLAFKSRFQFSPKQMDRFLKSGIENKNWHFIENNILPVHTMTEENINLYNQLFLQSAMHALPLLRSVVEKHGSQLNYALALDDVNKNTVLHHIMVIGDANLTLHLLDKGADLTLQNSMKKTPVQLAADHQRWDVIEKVASHYQSAENDTCKFGYALLLMARSKQWHGCDILLKQKNIRLDFQEPESALLGEQAGWTALNYFIAHAQEKLIALCIQHQADCPLRNTEIIVPEDAKAAYELALSNRVNDLQTMLSDAENKYYLINFSGYGAAAGNHSELTNYLIDEGAEDKFVQAGKAKALQKEKVSAAVSPVAFLPLPKFQPDRTGHELVTPEFV